MTSTTLLLTLHILGAALLIGNSVVTGYWKVMADRTGQPEIVAFAQRMVNVCDLVFLVPAIVLLAATGYLNSAINDITISGGGLLIGQLLFGAAGVLWLFGLVPTQRHQRQMSRRFATAGTVSADYVALTRRWNVLGVLTTVLLVGALVSMTAA